MEVAKIGNGMPFLSKSTAFEATLFKQWSMRLIATIRTYLSGALLSFVQKAALASMKLSENYGTTSMLLQMKIAENVAKELLLLQAM